MIPPYTAEYFNIKLVEGTQNAAVELAMGRTLNALMDKINEPNARLLKYLVVIMDSDILQDLDLADVKTVRLQFAIYHKIH